MIQSFSLEFIFHFMLVFARLATAFSNFPAIGSAYIFNRGRLVVSLAITFIMLPNLEPFLPKYTDNFALNIGYLAIEILIGIIISIAAKIYFQSLHFVGQVISMQSGLGAASFFDPQQKSQVTLFSNFMLLSVIVFIFISDIHYLFINAIVDSYSKFPTGEMLDTGDMSRFVTYALNDSFILSFKLASPFLIISLAMMTGSGLLARLMPNLQVFFVVTPAQIIVIFAIMYISINAIISKLASVIGMSVNVQGF